MGAIMLRYRIKFLLTVFIILLGCCYRQITVVQAVRCNSECLENKLDEILARLKAADDHAQTLTFQPENEPPATCEHNPNLQHCRQNVHNLHAAPATASTGDSSNHKCSERLAQICQASGVSEIQLDDPKVLPFTVLCGAERWIVVLQRLDGSIAFHNRTWDLYKQGFGIVGEKSEFFLGLQHLHELTHTGFFELRIDLEDFQGVEKYAHYNDFSIFNESAGYQLGILGTYHGTAGDSFTYHKGQQFSAMDRDKDDKQQGSCSEEYNSAGWFKNCMEANLFGNYFQGETNNLKMGMYWETFQGPEYSLKRVKVSVRAKC